VTDLDAVVARLKAADADDRQEDYDEGKATGESWAKEEARPRQLRRLAKLAAIPGRIHEQMSIASNGINRGIAVWLWRNVENAGVDADYMEEFWESLQGPNGADRIDEFDFADGFISGALAVWNQVSDKL
jgi:hypothetical protein